MVQKRLVNLCLAVLTLSAYCSAQDNITGAFDFSADKRVESEKLQKVIEELCKDRPNKEYFRLSTESNCRDAVRCVENDFRGGHTLAAIRCPTGLVFDLDGQTCNWAAKVILFKTMTGFEKITPLILIVVYLCINFYSMHSFFALPGWHHFRKR